MNKKNNNIYLVDYLMLNLFLLQCRLLLLYLIVFLVLYLNQFGNGLFCFSFFAYCLFTLRVLIEP